MSCLKSFLSGNQGWRSKDNREVLPVLPVAGLEVEKNRSLSSSFFPASSPTERTGKTGGTDRASWPTSLPGLGLRGVGAFTACADCPEGMESGLDGPVPRRRGVWTFYGHNPLCRLHAYERMRAEADDDPDRGASRGLLGLNSSAEDGEYAPF